MSSILTDRDREALRKTLLGLRSELTEELQELRATDATETPPTGTDVADRAESEAERALEHRQELDDTRYLRKIEFALRRLDEGIYEYCTTCGGAIPRERLFAKPSVSLCHACQLQRENGTLVEAPR